MSNIATADLLLAVDAGGTKTIAWLVDCSVSDAVGIVGRGKSSGGNPLSVGLDEATRAISEAVAQARSEAQAPDAPIERAILSIAGAADVDVRNVLVSWAHATGLARQVAIVSDFLPALAAGTRNCVGVALVSGTGSSAFARAADGRTARCGGWGYLLGDEGSGFAIGRAALQHALHASEANSEPDSLARKVLNALSATSVSEITGAIYRSKDVRANVAALAPLVTDAANNGEPQALSILEAAARDLADLATRAARAANLAVYPMEVAVSGGVLVNSSLLRERLQAELRKLRLDCVLNVVEEPLTGCVRLAASEFDATLVTWQSV